MHSRAHTGSRSNARWGPCRERLQAVEAKHRTLVQDKNNLQGEKAAMERELKVLRGQAGKLTKASQPAPTILGSISTALNLH